MQRRAVLCRAGRGPPGDYDVLQAEVFRWAVKEDAHRRVAFHAAKCTVREGCGCADVAVRECMMSALYLAVCEGNLVAAVNEHSAAEIRADLHLELYLYASCEFKEQR